jgi:hypothetical protein
MLAAYLMTVGAVCDAPLPTLQNGVAQNFSLPSDTVSSLWNFGPWGTEGAEIAYEFVAPSTGDYYITIYHTSTYYVDFGIAPEPGTEDGTDPVCNASTADSMLYLDDIFTSSTVTVTLQQGQKYLLVIDDENTDPSEGTVSMTFIVPSPALPPPPPSSPPSPLPPAPSAPSVCYDSSIVGTCEDWCKPSHCCTELTTMSEYIQTSCKACTFCTESDGLHAPEQDSCEEWCNEATCFDATHALHKKCSTCDFCVNPQQPAPSCDEWCSEATCYPADHALNLMCAACEACADCASKTDLKKEKKCKKIVKKGKCAKPSKMAKCEFSCCQSS